MSGAHTIELAGDSVMLLPEKAVYWPGERTLIVADIHFGKAAAFRSLGVPVPRGTTTQNLLALDRLLATYPATRIVFLGDFLHSRAAHANATLDAMAEWRARNAGLSLLLVRGNHDIRAGDPSAILNIDMVDEPFDAGPFSFCHHPDIAADGYIFAGHVHPVFRITTRHETVRLPCFLVGARRMILPSFGAFTGGYVIEPVGGERVFVATEVQVHPVR